MKHLDSQGHEFELCPVFAVQDLAERMGITSAPIAPGELSPEFRAILEKQDGVDFEKFHFAVRSGQGMGKAYEIAEPSSPLHKSADFQEADAVLRSFHETHDKKTLHEQLAPLVERACAKLSKENGELLRKAHAVLDLSILTYYLGRAFA